MATFRTRRLVAAVLVIAVCLVASSIEAGATGWHHHSRKTFTVDIIGTTPGAAPNTYAGDTDAGLRIRIANTARSDNLNSANVTVPAPYSVVAAPADAVPGGPVIELRNLGIAPHGSRDFVVTLAVRTCATSKPAPFEIRAKKTSDYSGHGSDFSLVAPSDLKVDTIGPCRLAFVAQPADAERNDPITAAPFAPGVTPITVEVRDAGSTGRATHASSLVSLSAANPAVPAPILGGTVSAAAVSGIATFSPGPTLGTSAFDYTLSASTSIAASTPPSNPFDIVDDQVSCPANQPCQETATATKGGQTVTTTFGTGASAVNLVVSIDAADAPTFECVGYPRPPGIFTSQFLFTGGDASDRRGTMSVVIPSATKPAHYYQACWAAGYRFKTRSGSIAPVGGTKPGTGEPLFVGLLPDCGGSHGKTGAYAKHGGHGTPVLPCVSGRSFDWRTKAVTVTVRATGADPWRY